MIDYVIHAKAKVNLFLHVIGKNNQNFHLLESLVCFTDDIYDVIEITKSHDLTLEIKGTFANKLSMQNNIIIKAANFLRQKQQLGAKIVLTKNLPIGAGIGGGSSNAASIIRLFSKIWNIEIDDNIISNLKNLGADVPCCFYGKAAYFAGIGEIIEPIANFPKIYVLLINSNKSLLTSKVFEGLNKDHSMPLPNKPKGFYSSQELIEFLSNTGNDMEQAASNIIPEIAQVIDMIRNQEDCHIARMSGSGATCFGLFTTERAVKSAYQNIKNKFNWWINYSMVS